MILRCINVTVESFGKTAADIQISIRNELQKICIWLDLNRLRINVAKSKFNLFHMSQKIITQLHFYLNGSPIDDVTECNCLLLTLDCNPNFNSHLKIIGISSVIGLLHKLKYIFTAYLLLMIHNSLILPHVNYSLLSWGSNCHSIELLQRNPVRVVKFKSPVAHTELIQKKAKMNSNHQN